MNTCIRSSRTEDVAHILMDRPDKKNALTLAMLTDLLDAFGSITHAAQGSAGPKAVVLQGSGAAFCSGFDLTLCRDNSDALVSLLTGLSRVIAAMRHCPLPVVVAAQGAALAGGCAMLGGADFVVSHHDAKIGYPVVRLGISPAISAPTLSASTGPGRARERLLDSALINGWEAHRLGLVHECIQDAAMVRDRATMLAQALASKPRSGVKATKALLNELDSPCVAEQMDRALQTSLDRVGSPEERERLTALWKA